MTDNHHLETATLMLPFGFAARQLANGIHEFRWQSTERMAVDAWLEYNDVLYQNTRPDETLRFLHIAESAQFPALSYVVRKARQLQMTHEEQPKTRSAVMFQSRIFGGLVNMLSTLLNRKGKDITRFFPLDEREAATAWLLRDD